MQDRYNILSKIKTPDDLKGLSSRQLKTLAAEVREELVNIVSENGGHLSSNLGVVELTMALCRVLDLPDDKLIWDVGHQSYVYKLFTGRRGDMHALRSMNGAGGFSSPDESEYDFCISGHSSTSLSVGLGAVMANELTGGKSRVCCVIGDGALTGGLAMEALDNIGHLKRPMLIVLNDNEMSITKNVGSISTLLSRARSGKKYMKAKNTVETALNKIPYIGEKLSGAARFVKEHIKYAVTAGTLFESMGITYLGPVDGHKLAETEDLLRRALSMDEPVVVHVLTKKGKGYGPAEAAPQKYHGVGPFDKAHGLPASKASYSSVFGDELCRIAKKNPKLAAITPSMTLGSGLSGFAKKYKDRFFDVGIAEGHAVTFTAGLAAGGVVPVVSVYSSFLQRAYDNIIHDLAIAGLHAVIAVDRAGLIPGDGATHQGIFDVAFLSAVPNVAILAPSSYDELRKMLRFAIEDYNGTIAVRFPRGGESRAIDNGDYVFGKAATLRSGTDITIAAYGSMVARALNCAELLAEKGISAEVIDMRTIKPFDTAAIITSGNKTGRLVFMEEVVCCGSIGEQLLAHLVSREGNFKFKHIALPDRFVPHATMAELEDYYGFTTEKLVEKLEELL
ncbi:MAG: 1-deoxy-D-xylulose-5-phosphate synthase [Oscillospiraceae bacterium]|nr:1-deoxy-D-xylulose-5-phosphate synthase [Oscillospiraceae bacterium]